MDTDEAREALLYYLQNLAPVAPDDEQRGGLLCYQNLPMALGSPRRMAGHAEIARLLEVRRQIRLLRRREAAINRRLKLIYSCD